MSFHFQRMGDRGSSAYFVLDKMGNVLGIVRKQVGTGRYANTTTTWWLADNGKGQSSTHRGRSDAARHLAGLRR